MITANSLSNRLVNQTISKEEIISDFRLALVSRQCSLLGRKEVLTGKAKFGIFGDGKEIAQIALAKQFKKGDWRSGYYRDQTFMMATGLLTVQQFFAQLYGTTDSELNPGNAGRSFNNHFATHNVDESGEWLDLTGQKNSAADLSPTAGHMPRLLGLALASRLYRQNPELKQFKGISINGNEVAFGTIGDASTSEGAFFETMNAAGVLQIPLAVAVWDDGYGISVPTSVQTIKSSISKALRGFEKGEGNTGFLIYEVKGWDYYRLIEVFAEGVAVCRREHTPVLFHVNELTQPQGHSTSGSHERYKSEARLSWEAENDCLVIMENMLLKEGILSQEAIDELKDIVAVEVEDTRLKAWNEYQSFIREEKTSLLSIIENRSCTCKREGIDKIQLYANNLRLIENPIRRDNLSTANKILRYICHDCPQRAPLKEGMKKWISSNLLDGFEKYSSRLYNETKYSAVEVKPVLPVYSENSPVIAGREVIRNNFDALFAKYPFLVAFGEDVGRIGGVNQTYEGLQKKYGEYRVFDTGIREAAIAGKGIGLALRGFRPIAEIQYFDYLLYALQALSDDLATLHWRTAGSQIAPLIISTRGHRLEGIWHSGSPLSMVINSIRGIHVCVPRNMTQAAGFYNTLLEGRDPALVIEPLNAYRLKEVMPDNPGEFRVPLGIPEILEEGDDITLVTYGSCVRIAQDACRQLNDFNIHVELIDVQTLLPFDLKEIIAESVKKTRKVVFFDEDVPGGATAFMMQQVVEGQGVWKYLDTPPVTLSAREHRPAYTTDGDYFSNPNSEDVFETVYQVMHRADPERYPDLGV
ncbi:MAG TPA: thiamine pyrophosphate-dependent enzyme [Bacteroidales bacterium]|nr:thiamine pyrophosphate-dependent enzyme [Bacteroidales bacterium]